MDGELALKIHAHCVKHKVGHDNYMKGLKDQLEEIRFQPFVVKYANDGMHIKAIVKELGISPKRFYAYLKRTGQQKTEYAK